MMVAAPLSHETWLICGGRDFDDEDMFENVMGDLMGLRGCPRKIIHGGASGADTLASSFAGRMSIDCLRFPAEWKAHGRAAGPIRNAKMLEQRPDLVVAFPGGRGTADMVAKARRAGIGVAEIFPEAKP